MMDRNTWIDKEIDTVRIGDERLIKRLKHIITNLSDNPEVSLPQAFKKPKDTKALYRFLSNDNINYKKIIDAHRDKTLRRIDTRNTVLFIQDTTAFNYKKAERIKGMGLAGSHDKAKGLIMHSTLSVTTDGVPLGIVSQDIWTRDPAEKGLRSDRKGSNNSHKFKIEEKESFKWIKAFQGSIENVTKNTNIVTICDREADIYRFFYEITQSKRDFIVRAGKKRRIEGEKILTDKVANRPIDGYINIKVPRNTRDSFPSREATLSIKYCLTKLLSPGKKEFRKMPPIEAYVVSAEEINAPAGIEPIKWFLLTTIPINCVEDGFKIVQWYKYRWLIERYHHILKSGCEIEKLHLEDVERVKNAIAIYSIVAWRIAWLTYESRNNSDTSCEKILSKDEWQCLYCVVNETSNLPDKCPTILEATIMIAKLGGFMARKSDGNPGVRVIWRGWRTLNNILIGWNTSKMVIHPKDMGKE